MALRTMFSHFSVSLSRVACSARFILAAAALSGAALAGANAPRQVTIAIVKDGPSWLLDDVATGFRQEAQTLTAGRATLTFKDAAVFDAGWSEGAAERSLDAALGDPAIDYVLALGVRTATAAAAPGRVLSKPVLGAVVQEADLAPLPIGANGRATKPNFAVVTLPSRASEQLAELRGVSRFASLQVLIDDGFAPNRAALEPWREQLARSLDAPVSLVPFGASADETLRALGDQPGTVFLFPAIRMDETNRAALLRELSARKFTVLSYLGQPDVEAGALAGVMPTSGPALARRLAINLDQLIAGTPSAELPLQVILPRQLFYNETTAAAIGHSADFAALSYATPIGRAAAAGGAPLTFTQAVLTALEKNFDFRAQQFATEASRQDVKAATGALLPQVAVSHSFRQIDRDRAAASGGAQPQSSYRAGMGLTQVIVDDEAFTRMKIAREAQRAASYLEQVERLDTVNAAGQAFLQLLSAEASLRVAEDNFSVTQRNLELARLRQRVGTSGPEEGYRFESLSAQQRSELGAARAQADRARVALNRALGVEITSRWTPRDVTLEDPAFAFTTGRVIALVRDRNQLERFRSFTAAYAVQHSPDLAAFEQNVKSRRLSADQKQRRSFTPKVSASIDYGRTIRQDLAGATLSEQFAAAGFPIRSETADRNDWTVGVTASLPLFTGGSVTAEARKARAELRQLELSRDGARESVMAQAQSSLYAVESAYSSIRFSRRAADLAAQNLALVQEKYEQGTVSIVTLLDAQNTAFAQRQSADASTYKFFAELLQFQRTLGWIEVLATPTEKDAWFNEVERVVTR
jgi:outer membrane protein